MANSDSDDPRYDAEFDSKSDRPPEFIERSAFLRQIFFEKHFRKAVILGVMLLIAVPLFVKKWWVASPPSVDPPIKVSGLDKVQAWSLRRSARNFAATKRLADAVTSWRMAIGNDACDPENSRGMLMLIRDWPSTAWEYQQITLAQSMWLLRLTHTNVQDLLLVGAVASRFEQDEVIDILFLPFANALTVEQGRILIPALFRRNEFDTLAGLFERYPDYKNDPELKLYHAAWLLGWGPRGSGGESRRILAAAAQQPQQRQTAHRLLLAVCKQLGQDDEYKQHLDQLEASQADHVADHVNYWLMLLARGQRDAVVEAIRGFNKTPNKPRESLALVSIFTAVGQIDEALRMLEKHRTVFPTAVELWVQSADLLGARNRWDDLRVLASELRRSKSLFDQAAGYTYYLEGLAFLNSNNNEAANRMFAKIQEVPLSSPLLGYITASGLTRLGRLEPARALLTRIEKAFGGHVEYWQQVLFAAYEARDIDRMLSAAERAYKLAPNNLLVVNNYAAALLILRQRPAEAIQLTLRRLQATPNDVGARINHALALLQNGRVGEAETVLKSIQPDNLNAMLHSILHFALFELNSTQGRGTEALKFVPKIDPKYLMPPQQKWLDESVQRLKSIGA